MTLEDRVRQYYTLFTERKLKDLAAMFTDDCLVIDFRGVEHHSTGIVRMFELYPPGCAFEPISMVTDGRMVLAGFRLTGGPPGLSAEGRDIFVFYGDKIRTLKTILPPS